MDFVAFKSSANPAVGALAPPINAAAQAAQIPPCLLAAIVARETGGRNILQIGVAPGPGCGCGLCQITAGVSWASITNPTYEGYPLLVPSENLHVAAVFFLAPLLVSAQRAQTERPGEFAASCRGQVVFAVAAGYNAGWGKVQLAMLEGVDADTQTTNGYAADVLSRYEAFVVESHA